MPIDPSAVLARTAIVHPDAVIGPGSVIGEYAIVDEFNRQISLVPRLAASQIRRVLVLHKELDADDGELTRTQKVRRSFIADRYEPLIKALYDGSKTADISVEVTFEDGRKGKIEGHMQVLDMPFHQAEQAPLREAAE